MSALGGKLTLTRRHQCDEMLRRVPFDKQSRFLVGLLLIISPILLSAVYLHAADLWPLWWGITDVIAGVTIIAVGIAGVCLLPIPGTWRAGLSGGYAAGTALLLGLSAIFFRGGL